MALLLRTMLVWAALILFSPSASANRRHIRRRYWFLSLDPIEELVRILCLVRAVELARRRASRRPMVRPIVGANFGQRAHRGALMRAHIGAPLRKALKHRDPRQRISRLLAALADIDGMARRYMLRRVLRPLGKLWAITIRASVADACVSAPALAPCAADTS